MKIALMTGADFGYATKIQPYLHSIAKNSNFDKNILVYTGDESLTEVCDIENIEVLRMKRSLDAAPNENNCLQHGSWLHAEGLNLEDEDVVVFTDGDIVLQRGLMEWERSWFSTLNHGEIAIGRNRLNQDDLYEEATFLQPKISVDSIQQDLKENLKEIPCRNTGVIACRVSTWKILYEEYVKDWPQISSYFGHYAKQQWLICLVINKDPRLILIDMPGVIHSRAHHYAIPPWTWNSAENLDYHFGRPILFLHCYHSWWIYLRLPTKHHK